MKNEETEFPVRKLLQKQCRALSAFPKLRLPSLDHDLPISPRFLTLALLMNERGQASPFR